MSFIHFFFQVSHVTVEHALIFLAHIAVIVIHGLQADTVRLTLMNVLIKVNVMWMWIRVAALMRMSPALKFVTTEKDLNVSVGMASQVL